MKADYAELLNLALTGLNAALKMVAEIKAQSGMTDDELLATAEQKGRETREQVAAYIKSLEG